MSQRHTLDTELVWQQDGHLSDVAVTSLADGQLDVLPESARGHAASCDACAERVGHAALLSLDAGEALENAAPLLVPEPAPEPLRRPLPTVAVVAALAIAVMGLLPSLPLLRAILMQTPGLLLHTAPALIHSTLVVLMSAGDPAHLAVLWCAVAVMLMAAGLVVARLAPRRASKGEH